MTEKIAAKKFVVEENCGRENWGAAKFAVEENCGPRKWGPPNGFGRKVRLKKTRASKISGVENKVEPSGQGQRLFKVTAGGRSFSADATCHLPTTTYYLPLLEREISIGRSGAIGNGGAGDPHEHRAAEEEGQSQFKLIRSHAGDGLSSQIIEGGKAGVILKQRIGVGNVHRYRP